ncbi:unnamed protein product [Effrenium voratum]|uniref:Uncharacterized protein n=1 Tax=Effrenium voratum TaxID=2562239 RepID=A0AA36J101_9DINO|nr:unnamed protein product [Effrenium voratum]CAJ1421138.1 unnamed protein product [Effrenium voratum]
MRTATTSVHPTAVPLSEEADEDDEMVRQALLEGIQRLSADPEVSSEWRLCLAVLRALIFGSFAVAGLYLQSWWCSTHPFVEAVSSITGTLGANTSVSSVEDNCLVDLNVQDIWAQKIREFGELGSMEVKITPVGTNATLQTLWWYNSEEAYQNRRGWVYLLSLGARLMHPVHVDLTINKVMTEAEYITEVQAALEKFHNDAQGVSILKGDFMVDNLAKHDEMTWHDNRWNYYKASWDWQFLCSVAFVIIFVLMSTMIKFVVMEAERDWKAACEVWIAQHDKLWYKLRRRYKYAHRSHTLDPAVFKEQLKNAKEADKPGAAAGVTIEVPLKDRLKMCSPFFVLDNSIANAYRCEEEALWACASALLHAATFSCCPVFMCMACHFKPDWVDAFNYMLGVYALISIPLGFSYYFALDHGRLNIVFSGLQIVLMFCWVVLTLLYIVSSLVYLSSVSAVDPAMIQNALVPLATMFAYVTVIFSRLKALQEHYVAVGQGKAPKGFVLSVIHRLGLSTAMIIIICLEGLVSLFGIFLLQVAMRNLYAGAAGARTYDLVQCAVLPSFALVNGIIKLKNDSRSDAEDAILPDWVNTFQDII